jgi:hypothetical protein
VIGEDGFLRLMNQAAQEVMQVQEAAAEEEEKKDHAVLEADRERDDDSVIRNANFHQLIHSRLDHDYIERRQVNEMNIFFRQWQRMEAEFQAEGNPIQARQAPPR